MRKFYYYDYTIINLLLLCTFTVYIVIPCYSLKFTDYQMKSGYILNFTRHVEWPEESFTNNDDPIVISVYGDDIFNSVLDELIKKRKTINNHPLIYKQFQNIDELQPCHILFISPNKNSDYEKVYSKLNKSPTLIVGERDQFYENIQHINFKLKGNIVKYDVNKKAFEDSKLKPRSFLLRYADIIVE